MCFSVVGSTGLYPSGFISLSVREPDQTQPPHLLQLTCMSGNLHTSFQFNLYGCVIAEKHVKHT